MDPITCNVCTGGRGHPASVGVLPGTRTHPTWTPALPPSPPTGPALTPPVTEPRPSERPSPNPASAAQGCAPAPPTEGQPHPHPVIGQPGPWQEPIGCSVCPFPAAPRPRARAFLRGHVAARGAPPLLLKPNAPPGRAREGRGRRPSAGPLPPSLGLLRQGQGARDPPPPERPPLPSARRPGQRGLPGWSEGQLRSGAPSLGRLELH